MSKEKRVERTKEQIAAQLKTNNQQDLIEKAVFPAVVAATTSIDEAKMLLRAISTSIMEKSMEVLRETKMADVRKELVKKLTEEGREEEVDALLAALDDQTLLDSRMLVEGLSSAIEQMIIDEMRNRTLNSLEVDWKRVFNR